ncbi:MAG: TonB-dependent receptor [Bacteroidales bacterium]|nr:TonB-dependent receptor [Bacteroidales bacterium]
MKNFVLLVVFFLAFLATQSQEKSSISGNLIDQQTSQPVANAEIILIEDSIITTSDDNGYFVFKNLPKGYYSIRIRHIAYHDVVKKIKLNTGENIDLKFTLTGKSLQLEEFIVESESETDQIISKLPYIETSIVKREMDKNASRDVGDFLRSSNNIGGIRKGGTQLDPVVRGFKYSQLNIQMNNGQKIEGGCPNRMDPATAHVEIEDIEKIEVYKGPYALRYGQSFGGVINLKTVRPEPSDSFQIHINALKGYESNWNGNKEQLAVQGESKKVFFNLSGGRKDYGNYKDGNSNEVKTSFKKYNYKGQLGFVPHKNHSIIMTYEESNGRDVSFPTLPMDERKDDTRLISLDYNAGDITGLINSFNLKLYNSDVRHEMDTKERPFSDTTVAVSIINALNQGGRLEAGIPLSKGLLYAGVDFEQIKKDGERTKTMIKQPGLPVKREQLWNNAEINNFGVFAEYSITLGKFELVAASRLDFNKGISDSILVMHPMQGEIFHYSTDSIQSEYINFSISAGANQKITQNLTLSLSLGRGVRSPDMTERYIILLPIGYDKFDYLGDPQLKPETNNQADLTVKFTSHKIGLLQVNGFYSLVNDYITGKRLPPSIQKPLTQDVLGVKQFYNAGNARFRGFELTYSTPLHLKFGIKLYSSYTCATLDKVHKYILNDQGSVVDDVELENDALTEIPPFESKIVVHYRFFKGKFIPQLSYRIVAAQNHVSEASYEQETPGFSVIGFSFTYLFNKYFTVSGGVDNIFDKAYYEHLNRNIIGSNGNLYEPGRVFFVNLFFKI